MNPFRKLKGYVAARTVEQKRAISLAAYEDTLLIAEHDLTNAKHRVAELREHIDRIKAQQDSVVVSHEVFDVLERARQGLIT